MDTPKDPFEDQNAPSNLEKLQAENRLENFEHQLEDAQKRNFEFARVIEEISIERDCLKSQILGVEGIVREREEWFLRKIDDGMREKECLEVEIYEGMREREELVRKIDVVTREKEGLLKELEVVKGMNKGLVDNLSRGLGVLGLIKECFLRVNEGLDEKILENGVDFRCDETKEDLLNMEGNSFEWKEMRNFLGELDFMLRMAKRVEQRLNDYQEKEHLLKEIEAHKTRNKELEESLWRGSEIICSIKESLMRISESLDEEDVEFLVDHKCEVMKEEVSNFNEKSEDLKEEVKDFSKELGFVLKLAKRVEDILNDYQEKVKKEKRELENSVVSLTEENRDVNTLLRIALVEKEAVEKSLNKLKGNNEQRRVPLLQIAERGLQRVGFGFIMGGVTNEHSEQQKKDIDQTSDNMASNASTVSDVSSECDEEVVSLASTVEKMMKNLRLEITQLRRALEESRSDTERLQSFTEKQAQQIEEQTIYIKELEDRERILDHKVEELLMEIKAAEDDVERWREACELEVKAGKYVVEERDKMVAILKQELERTRASLEVSNSKLKLKEELAIAAMAAQSAAERSLQLADSRASGLRERIEELTRQLEEVESREKNSRRKFRRICWPWQALKVVNPPNAANNRARSIDIRRVIPEMQALIHSSF